MDEKSPDSFRCKSPLFRSVMPLHHHQHLLFWHLTKVWHLQRSSCSDIERKKDFYICGHKEAPLGV